jgi:hypothetical protein
MSSRRCLHDRVLASVVFGSASASIMHGRKSPPASFGRERLQAPD